ncbi:hypothetical protein ACWDLG_41670 [Nonomuraea sp. NPDC003727]
MRAEGVGAAQCGRSWLSGACEGVGAAQAVAGGDLVHREPAARPAEVAGVPEPRLDRMTDRDVAPLSLTGPF